MQRRRARGFTLIELMIVVAIIGILAALAIPNYVNYTLKARQSEAVTLLGAIQNQQFAFYASHDCFAATPQTPAGAPGPQTQQWISGPGGFINACAGPVLTFDDIDIRPTSADVFFAYQCVATIAGVNGPTHDFTCTALGDLDGNGIFYELAFCTDFDGNGFGLPTALGTACGFPGQPVRLSTEFY